MCAIFIRQGVGEIEKFYVESKLKMMKHRGPDDQQVAQIGGMSLGVARLAIVQAHSGNQPHLTEKQRVVMFNGELYNYLELAAPLGSTAWTAPSEVQFLGECLDAGVDPRLFFDGDFAIAYYDPTWKRLALFRDRFGVVPLYYQLKPAVEVSSERRRLMKPVELLAGEMVVINVARGSIETKDRLPIATGMTCSRTPIGTQASIIRSMMRDAALSRAFHSDRSVSVVLSGGLDSALLANSLVSIQDGKVKEYITVTMDARSAETKAARATLERMGIQRYKHNVVEVSEDQIRAATPAILTHLLDGAPHNASTISRLRWTGAVRLWFAAQACSTKVLLGGDGLDEMLGGYLSHFAGAETQVEVAMNSLSSLRSMASFNLDRANKMAMAHSVEYRPPFLSHALANYLMSLRRTQGKQVLRYLLRDLELGDDFPRPKYYEDDESFANTCPSFTTGETNEPAIA